MSVFKDEPKVFSDAYKLTLDIFHATKSFPKPYRPSLGRRIEEHALDMTQSIRIALFSPLKATSNREASDRVATKSLRLEHLTKASHCLDEIRVVLKFSYDLKIISIGKYQEFSEHTQELGRELGGLLKAASKGQGNRQHLT